MRCSDGSRCTGCIVNIYKLGKILILITGGRIGYDAVVLVPASASIANYWIVSIYYCTMQAVSGKIITYVRPPAHLDA